MIKLPLYTCCSHWSEWNGISTRKFQQIVYLFIHSFFVCVCPVYGINWQKQKYVPWICCCCWSVHIYCVGNGSKKKQTKLECVHVKHKVYRQLKPNTHTTCFEWVQRAYIAVYRIVASQCERLFFYFALDKWKAYSTVCIRNPIVYSIYECTRYWYGKQSIWTGETTTTTKNNRIIYSHWGWVLGNDSKIRYFHVFIVIK